MDFGAFAGGIGSFIGQMETNKSNRDTAAEANRFSAEQYARRYQTTVKDLMAADLNPMLAYSQGPGNAPTGQIGAPAQNAIGAGVDSYNRTKATSAQSALNIEQVNQVKSQTELNNANSAKSEAEAEVARNQAKLIEQQVPKVITETKTSEELGKAYIQQSGASAAQAARAYEEIKNIAQNNENLRAELKRLQQANDQSAPESEIAKKYPTFYYIFHKLMPSLSGSAANFQQGLKGR